MKTTTTLLASLVATSALLAGCASPYQQPSNVQSYPAAQTYPAAQQGYPSNTQNYGTQYGVVDSIQMTRGQTASSGPGVGAVVGGVVGGLLGNQVGGGNGKKAATVAGVVGGALVGNQIEQTNRNQATADAYQINVRLDNGSYVAVTQENANDLRVGNRVRIENGRVYRY
jgi:outer membrane lipoprotein SlyB